MIKLDKGCSLIGEAAKDNRRAARALVRTVLNHPNKIYLLIHYSIFVSDPVNANITVNCLLP